MNENNENLNELLSGFYDEREASEFKNDLNSFDEMFSETPAPSMQTLDSIKKAVGEKLSSRKHSSYAVLRRIAVAAVIVMITFAGLKMTDRQLTETEVTRSDVTYNIFDEGDASQIALLTAQAEQIEDALLSVRLDEYDSYSDDSYSELETELNEINGDFWKG